MGTLMGVASREPNLEGTSPSPIPVAASPSGQLRIVDDSGGRIHRVQGGGDKSVEMEMNNPAERAGNAGVCGGSAGGENRGKNLLPCPTGFGVLAPSGERADAMRGLLKALAG